MSVRPPRMRLPRNPHLTEYSPSRYQPRSGGPVPRRESRKGSHFWFGANRCRSCFWPAICVAALSLRRRICRGPKPRAQTESTSSRSSIGPNRDKLDQVVDHLLKAAEHLEAAGLVDESARLRDDARQRAVRDNVLCTDKEAELECLQEEVDRLRKLMGQVPVVVIEIMAIEVDRSKLGLKKHDFDKMVGFSQADSPSTSSALSKGRFRIVEEILGRNRHRRGQSLAVAPLQRAAQKGAIDVLAHPTMQTATHRPASVLVGGEIPIRVKSSTGDVSIRSVPFGTR